jgi:hypothetical protein
VVLLVITGGIKMENGYYIDFKRWDINLEGRGRPINPLLALLVTPIMGLAFLMFLPFIGFYLSVQALFKKFFSVFNLVTVPSPTVVGQAHLTGHEGDKKIDSPVLEELSKEIDSRRK